MRTHHVGRVLLFATLPTLAGAAWLDRVSIRLLPETTIWLTGSSESYLWSCSQWRERQRRRTRPAVISLRCPATSAHITACRFLASRP